MKLETFFEKFELFAEAPDAVTRMREVIFELSAAGRLLPEVLENPVKDDTKLMGAVVQLVMGQAPPGHDCNTDGKGSVFVKVGEFGPLFPREESWTTNPLKFAQKGDVLICVVGATVGKLNLAIDCAIGRSVAAIRPSSIIDTKFLFYSLFPYTLRLRRNSRGSAQGVIGKTELNAMSLWVPSIDLQKRIVAKVDELMALCDLLEAQQQERQARHAALVQASLARFTQDPTPANLQFLFHPSYTVSPADLRKTILTLAVQGKLVPQDPDDENVENILVRNDERRRVIARSDHRAKIENQPLLSADDCWEIEDTWAWRGLADLVLFVDYRGKTPAKRSSGIRLLTAKNVRKGQINLSPEEYLSEEDYYHWMTRGFPRAGDVLFTTEAPMGNAAVVDLTDLFALAQRVICFQTYGALDSSFLVLQLLSDQFQLILDKNGTGVTAKGIKSSKLKQLPIAVPPLAEQRRIVAKVDELMALVDELETQLAASRTVAQNLLAALVRELTTTP